MRLLQILLISSQFVNCPMIIVRNYSNELITAKDRGVIYDLDLKCFKDRKCLENIRKTNSGMIGQCSQARSISCEKYSIYP